MGDSSWPCSEPPCPGDWWQDNGDPGINGKWTGNDRLELGNSAPSSGGRAQGLGTCLVLRFGQFMAGPGSQGWGRLARAACPFSHCGAGERTCPWGGCGGTGVLCSPVTHQQEGCGREGYGAPGPGHLTQIVATGLPPWEDTQAGSWVLGELLWAPLPVLVGTIPACFKVPVGSARSTQSQCCRHHAPPRDGAGKATLQRAGAGWHSQRWLWAMTRL